MYKLFNLEMLNRIESLIQGSLTPFAQVFISKMASAASIKSRYRSLNQSMKQILSSRIVSYPTIDRNSSFFLSISSLIFSSISRISLIVYFIKMESISSFSISVFIFFCQRDKNLKNIYPTMDCIDTHHIQ